MNCGEGDFPIRRLSEIAQSYTSRFGIESDSLLEGVLIENLRNEEQLEEVLKEHLPNLIPLKNVRLVVIDSIAGVFRTEYGDRKLTAFRSNLLLRLAARMKKLSYQHAIPFVCVNQVSGSPIHNSTKLEEYGKQAYDLKAFPSLGLTWSHCVNRRFILSRSEVRGETVRSRRVYPSIEEEEKKDREGGGGEGRSESNESSNSNTPFMSFGFGYSRFERVMEVLFSPSCPHPSSARFIITDGGVFGEQQEERGW